ncbi:MAG: hypothetical protein V1783_04280 [Bacteroidota bacterium]
MEETKKNILTLKKSGFFNSWSKKETELITFFIHPDLVLPDNWIEKRLDIYKENAEKLNVISPKITFYIYPSIDAVKDLGVIPAITFVKAKEIHGHIKQSPGHELTHILLGEISPSEDLPANGLWAEGICVYLDGTNTDRKKHTISLNYDDEIIKTPWDKWRENLPSDFYPLAGSIIQYCVEKYDWDVVKKFLKELRNSGENDEKISSEIFSLPYRELQENWQEWLKKIKQADFEMLSC